MSKRWLILIPVVLTGLPAVAQAQITGVIFNRSALTNDQRRINIEELFENEVNQATVELSWSVSGLTAMEWNYELTYGAITETSTDTTLVRVVQTDARARNMGDQPLGSTLTVEVLLRDLIENEEDLPVGLGAGRGRDDFDAAICVNVYPAGNRDPVQTASECWTFDVDTLGPPPPTNVGVVPGEKRVQVTWTPVNSDDIEFYEIVYCVSVTSSVATSPPLCTPDRQRSGGRIGSTLAEGSITEGIRLPNEDERIFVEVAVRSIDEFDNPGGLSDPVLTEPAEVLDFFELYEGGEEGGFCFMATAAFGSYAHPAVRVLRAFRDQVLMATPLGAAFVWAYYRYAPPLAAQVAADPALAAQVRLWLIPLAALAILLMLCPVLAVAWLLRAGLRLAPPVLRRPGPWAGLGVVAILATPATSSAQRPDSELETLGLGFEFKGGPYSGNIQEDAAFNRVFPSNSRPLFTVGMDLQLLRSFGTVTLGGSFGYLQYVGKAPFAPPDEDPKQDLVTSSDTNVFNLVPLTLQLGYRFDVLADELSWFPLVPYAKGGLAYYIWWATDGIGDLQRRRDGQGELIGTARGGTFGVTGTLGLAFMLNTIDRRAAQTLFSSTGIRGTYVFVEVTGSQVDDFGSDGFDLSDYSWNVGVYMEL